MEQRRFIEFMGAIEKLKCNTRHSYTSSGRQESVAEHCWRLAVMAMLCKDEFPALDMNKVIKMCLVHDFGEALTGDIPAFVKTEENETEEELAVEKLLSALPEGTAEELGLLFAEMKEMKTEEARLYKALDNIEALISHNESALSTWTEEEYKINLEYGNESSGFSTWTRNLREEVRKDSINKIQNKNGGQM